MKKLNLNKETLLRLQEEQMHSLVGAAREMSNDDSAGVCVSNGDKACDVDLTPLRAAADGSCCKKSCNG